MNRHGLGLEVWSKLRYPAARLLKDIGNSLNYITKEPMQEQTVR
jgi:hypothetical protein